LYFGSVGVALSSGLRNSRPEEFLAGSFILTQQSLLEAPYR